jgi:phosphatidylserine/phosphatidylglycerophosphate/cardiolipin synthase-like enzyme
MDQTQPQILIGSDYPDQVIPLIDAAKVSIDILMFDWRWYENGLGTKAQALNQALVLATRRGVKVRAIVNSQTIRQSLLEVKIEAKICNSSNLQHSKLMIIDKLVCVIGSHNISHMAFESNFETSAVIKDLASAEKLTKYFENLWFM